MWFHLSTIQAGISTVTLLLDRFEKTVAMEGMMLVNSSLITHPPERNDVRVLSVPANDIALSPGNSQVVNMVALGTVVKVTQIMPLELTNSAMAKMLSHKDSAKMTALNERALDAEYNAV